MGLLLRRSGSWLLCCAMLLLLLLLRNAVVAGVVSTLCSSGPTPAPAASPGQRVLHRPSPG